MSRRLPRDVLPFKQFVQRSRVLGLYRSLLRETIGLEGSHARELRRLGGGRLGTRERFWVAGLAHFPARKNNDHTKHPVGAPSCFPALRPPL
jgi:hypothetical protein